MIVFGTGSRVSDLKKIEGHGCVNCGNESVFAGKVFKFFELYFVPTIPLGSKLVSSCGHCKIQMDSVEISRSGVKEEITALTKDIKRPLYHYAGTVIGLALFALIFLRVAG